jgi:hypothetical protein
MIALGSSADWLQGSVLACLLGGAWAAFARAVSEEGPPEPVPAPFVGETDGDADCVLVRIGA